ncbi:MAG TPA: phosphopantetheine-binding protein [Propionibacteriaceae bacterium]|nr:phosphopantetheine-binding protein [Propionibacteriaceae bacterium]
MTDTSMPAAELRGRVVARLREVAPEVDADDLRDAVPLRKQVDLDSMDWLVFLVALHDEFHVDIPEADYATLVSLGDIVRYLGARVAG